MREEITTAFLDVGKAADDLCSQVFTLPNPPFSRTGGEANVKAIAVTTIQQRSSRLGSPDLLRMNAASYVFEHHASLANSRSISCRTQRDEGTSTWAS